MKIRSLMELYSDQSPRSLRIRKKLTLSQSITAHKVIAEIQAFVGRVGGLYGNWYAGISAQPSTRLSSGHGVALVSILVGHANYWDCGDENVARYVEEQLLDFGFDGGEGGGSEDNPPNWVYVFRKTETTSPRKARKFGLRR